MALILLGHLGMHGLAARHFCTSAMNTADFLSETDPRCTVYVIGEGGLLSALHERKIPSDAIHPRYVVVGEGTTSMEKLIKAHECLEHGARLLVTNPDNWCPVSADRTRPGAGATAAFLEASTGHVPRGRNSLLRRSGRLPQPAGRCASTMARPGKYGRKCPAFRVIRPW